MIVLAIILAVIALILLFSVLFQSNKDISDSAKLGAAITLGSIISIVIFLQEIYPPITPMDVYQGKTELHRTFNESGECIDSVVVFKERKL